MGSPTSNTDQLIERLVADASPVRRLVDPRRRAALWTAIALVCTGLGVAHFGVRRDIAGAMTFLPFLLRVGLLAATMAVSGRGAPSGGAPGPAGLDAVVAAAAAQRLDLGRGRGLVVVSLVGGMGSPLRAGPASAS